MLQNDNTVLMDPELRCGLYWSGQLLNNSDTPSFEGNREVLNESRQICWTNCSSESKSFPGNRQTSQEPRRFPGELFPGVRRESRDAQADLLWIESSNHGGYCRCRSGLI